MDCTVCLSTKKKENVCVCTTCKDTGIICHECVQGWKAAGHDPWICTICKNPKSTMQNLPYILSPNAANILITLPPAILEVDFRCFSLLVTLYGILLLISILFITFLFTYVTLLISVGFIQHFVLAIENTVLTIEYIL
jgi:hypothetical protein